MKLPEHTTAPEIYYNREQCEKYTSNTRIIFIQQQMAQRCLELSNKNGGFALDVGCGSGISGEVLRQHGFEWIGIDISPEMLRVCGGDVVNGDVGAGLPFQPGTFDAVISISCVQWLFHSYATHQIPIKRIRAFFRGTFSILKSEGVCVLQFYCTEIQTKTLREEAAEAGFDGTLVIDHPGTKNEKTYLVLYCRKADRAKQVKRQRVHALADAKSERRSQYGGRKRHRKK